MDGDSMNTKVAYQVLSARKQTVHTGAQGHTAGVTILVA